MGSRSCLWMNIISWNCIYNAYKGFLIVVRAFKKFHSHPFSTGKRCMYVHTEFSYRVRMFTFFWVSNNYYIYIYSGHTVSLMYIAMLIILIILIIFQDSEHKVCMHTCTLYLFGTFWNLFNVLANLYFDKFPVERAFYLLCNTYAICVIISF